MMVSHYGWKEFGFWGNNPKDPSFRRLKRYSYRGTKLPSYSLKIIYTI